MIAKNSMNTIRWIVLLVLIIGLLATYSSWHYAEKNAIEQANERFLFRTQQTRAAINEHMLAYENALRGGAGLFSATHNQVNAEAWKAYISTLNITENYPGIQGVGYSKHINPEALADHVAEIRRQGFPDYTVKPAGDRAEYTAIVYLEPFNARNKRAFGFDMFSEPTRHAAMEQARDSGKTVVSGKVKLVQERNKEVQAGFLMYLPVYNGTQPGNKEQRKLALLGYVYSAFRMNDLMDGILGKGNSDLGLQVYDGNDIAEKSLMYSSFSNKPNEPLPLFTNTKEIDINGHVWSLRYSTLPLFEAGIDKQTPQLVAAFGMLLTALFGLLFWSIINTRIKAQAMANAMTTSLRESSERLRSVVDTALDGIFVLNEAGIIESCNAAMHTLFGYTEEELVGNHYNVLVTSAYQVSEERSLARLARISAKSIHAVDGSNEVAGLRKNGGTFAMDLALGEMYLGEQRKYTGMVRDITERKQAKALLDEQVRFITELMETMPTPIYFKDTEGRYLGFNRAFEALFGAKRECLQDNTLNVLYANHPEVAEFHRQKDAELFQSKLAQSFETSVPTLQGVRHVLYSKAPYYRGDVVAGLIGVIYDVTERKQQDDVLSATLQLQRSILECSDYAIISTAIDGTIVVFNRAAERILGYQANELIGKETPGVFHLPQEVVARAKVLSEELGQEITPGFDVFVAKSQLGVPDENEWTYVCKDGTHVPVLLSVTALRNEHNEVTGYLGVASDITERKRIESALHESEERYRMIAEYASDMITQIDGDGIIQYISPACINLLGYQPDELLNKSIFDRVHPDDLRNAQEMVSSAVKNDQMGTLTCRMQKQNRDYIWMETTLRGLHIDDGMQAMASPVLGISRDVTERVQTSSSLNRFKHILDNTLDMLFMFEPDTLRFVYMNKGAVESMGYSIEELLQMAPYHIKPLIAESEFRALIVPLLSGEKKSLSFETVHRRKDGRDFPVEIFLQLVQETDGKGLFVALVRDITERQKIDRLKSEFVSTVSHELRTPLTSIRGSLGLVLGGVTGGLPAQSKSMLDIAYKNTERLVRLINDILDIEKIESGNMSFDMQPQSLMPIIEQVMEVNRAYGDQFGVQFEITAALPDAQVKVDQDRLTQVMANILSNAAKFSHANGRIEISVTPSQGKIRISVTDHGEGIPEAFRSKIFQKFSQADASDTKQKGGTGLGLSISKAMVEKMGGTMDFVSEMGQGSCFYFELPEWREEQCAPSLELEQDKTSLRRVLVCEDDHDIAKLLGIMLNSGGFEVDVAHDAVQAKALLAQHHYIAMTLDFGLQDQNGIALIQELRENKLTQDLPIVVISAIAEEGRAEIMSKFSVIDWLSKPIDQQRLLQLLDKVGQAAQTERPRILHVEDDPDIRQIIAALVKDAADLDCAGTLEEARTKLKHERYHLVILDLELPDGSGWELLPTLQQSGRQTPVLIFSVSNVGSEEAQQVSATLVKSSTNNQELLDTINVLAKGGIY